jgi:hypothetical protein
VKLSPLIGVLLLSFPLALVGCKENTTAAKKELAAVNKDSDRHDHEHDREHGRKNKVAAAELEKKAESKEEDKVAAVLATLEPEKRKLAEAQKYCPIHDAPLGSMGAPFELTIDGQLVFLCCDGCEKAAKKEPEKTLAKAKELVAKNAPAAK